MNDETLFDFAVILCAGLVVGLVLFLLIAGYALCSWQKDRLLRAAETIADSDSAVRTFRGKP